MAANQVTIYTTSEQFFLTASALSLTPTSNSLTEKYIHFIQSTFTSVDTQSFASKGILQRQQTTINTILLYIGDNRISIKQDISLNPEIFRFREGDPSNQKVENVKDISQITDVE